MADQPDRPDQGPDAATPANEPVPPPAASSPAAKKAGPAKKAAAKKAPAKKAVAKKVAPAKKAPAKKAPAKAAPAKAASEPAQSEPAQLVETNGNLASAAKEAAAHAKSTVATASNAVSGPPPVQRADEDSSRLPMAAALVTGLLAILAVLYIARRGSGD
ncbi:MAG TPA: hypothetical protein VIQ11_12340 [Mycobacterium sp.]